MLNIWVKIVKKLRIIAILWPSVIRNNSNAGKNSFHFKKSPHISHMWKHFTVTAGEYPIPRWHDRSHSALYFLVCGGHLPSPSLRSEASRCLRASILNAQRAQSFSLQPLRSSPGGLVKI